MTRSVAFITMGCAKNEVDSSHMAERLGRAGYKVIADPDAADVVIVNTCSFIQAATEESIEAILDAAESDSVAKRGARLIVAGCMPARYGGDLALEFPEVAAFVPCKDEDAIAEILDGLFDDVKGGGADREADAFDPYGEPSAYVKISDGCDRFCAYCSIPYIRGRYHSFGYDEIRAEVEKHVGRGVREIVLIAQDTGRWGDDLEPRSSLAALVSSLADEFEQTWFRVLYIQPEGVTDDLIEAVASHDNICSYFDIPFQHVVPRILKAMNRSGNAGTYTELLDRIRNRIPDAVMRTTLIAGFPGETDEDFEELCSFVENADLDYVGVFAYSREEGTRAYDMPDQVDDDEKSYRAQRLRDIGDSASSARIAQRIGVDMDVLVCGFEEDGQLYGRAFCQAPDVDGVTYIDAGGVGDIIRVRIVDTLMYEMEGESLDELHR